MTDTTLPTPGLRSTLRHLWQDQRVWLASALILAALAVFDMPQAADSRCSRAMRCWARRPS